MSTPSRRTPSRKPSEEPTSTADASNSGKRVEALGDKPGSRRARGHADESSIGLDLGALVFGLAIISLLFQTYAPEPYMDEPFHVRQTQKYCLGHFSDWDPKITTFPGLYVAAAALGRLQHAFFGYFLPSLKSEEAELCGTGVLRAVNVGFAAVCFLLLHCLYRKIHPGISSESATQMALVILLLPTNFFYIFLFYTDVGSLASVLASLLASLHQRYFFSGLAAAVAVFFRQTNAVWAVFILMVAVLQRFYTHNLPQMKTFGLSKQIVVTLKLCWLNRRWLLTEIWPLLLVPTCFVGFAIWNGGIVVGDRSNHTPVLHLAQPLYFLLFAAAALWQVHFHPARISEAIAAASEGLRQRPATLLKQAAMGFVACSYAVHNFTLVHPFVLADNRHYVFYLWKDLIAPYPAAKYSLVPLYLYAAWSVRRGLRDGGQLDVWILGLAVSVMLTLVPAWLLEFRYFTTAVVLVALYTKPPTAVQRLLMTATFAVVNAVTIYVFLFKPFQWADGSLARFMW